MSSGPVSRPWRRFLHLSVRGLIVLVLVFGVWLGWLVRGARIQREAVEAIEKDRGIALHNWQWKDGHGFHAGEPAAPRWLVNRIGADYFGHVVGVFFLEPKSDALLPHVGQLSQVETLHLSGPFVTDAGLARLRGLTKLSRLGLHRTKVTDAGLTHLGELAELSWISVTASDVTDAGLVHLEGLVKLSALNLVGTKVSDAGLVQLRRLRHLSDLNLSVKGVTDAGLAHLKGLTKLSELNLFNTNTTDGAMNELRQELPSLKITR
jgi:hypothetical protein